MLQWRAVDSRKALTGAFLCAAYLLTLAASLALTLRGGIPPFWPCTAFIAAMVLLVDRRVLWVGLAVAAAGSTPLLMHYSPTWQIAVFRVVFNLGEGVMAGCLGRWGLGPRRLLRTAVSSSRGLMTKATGICCWRTIRAPARASAPRIRAVSRRLRFTSGGLG